MLLWSWRHSDRTGMGVVELRNVFRRNRRAWWARFTFNGITRYHHGAYGLVGGEDVTCLLTQKPAASGTGAARARRSAARSNTGCSPGPRAAANAAGPFVAWQTPHQRALEVDHIVPRNQGGSDDLSKLQALCFRCNAGKRWEARDGLWVLRA